MQVAISEPCYSRRNRQLLRERPAHRSITLEPAVLPDASGTCNRGKNRLALALPRAESGLFVRWEPL